eukprot:GHVT01015677.1.p1 GENE.GHVT01015677.1~~GHVT01015677.1.p1  ORF type:complete len:335 (+),score=89.14 GHVT01015677.1:639-1643(+)
MKKGIEEGNNCCPQEAFCGYAPLSSVFLGFSSSFSFFFFGCFCCCPAVVALLGQGLRGRIQFFALRLLMLRGFRLVLSPTIVTRLRRAGVEFDDLLDLAHLSAVEIFREGLAYRAGRQAAVGQRPEEPPKASPASLRAVRRLLAEEAEKKNTVDEKLLGDLVLTFAEFHHVCVYSSAMHRSDPSSVSSLLRLPLVSMLREVQAPPAPELFRCVLDEPRLPDDDGAATASETAPEGETAAETTASGETAGKRARSGETAGETSFSSAAAAAPPLTAGVAKASETKTSPASEGAAGEESGGSHSSAKVARKPKRAGPELLVEKTKFGSALVQFRKY